MKDRTADIIKLAAVATAAPRWVAALLLAEGLQVPADWLWWWLPLAALLNAGMALTEGLAFAYIFSAWKQSTGKQSSRLFALAVLSAVSFVGILAPYVAGAATGRALSEMLAADWAAWLWGICVASSTMVIVAGVGYAQRHRDGGNAQAELDAAQERVAEYEQAQGITALLGDLTKKERAWLFKELNRRRNGDEKIPTETIKTHTGASATTISRA